MTLPINQSQIVHTTAEWQSLNPTLDANVIGIEIMANGYNRYKRGDGITAWNSLAYIDKVYVGSDITIDATPTSGSGNAVASGGVYTALTEKAAVSHTHSYLPLTGGAISNDLTVGDDLTVNGLLTLSSENHGSFTPSLVGGVSSYGTNRYGRYFKIGDMLVLMFHIEFTASSTRTKVQINLPFTVSSGVWGGGGGIMYPCEDISGNRCAFTGFYLNNNKIETRVQQYYNSAISGIEAGYTAPSLSMTIAGSVTCYLN